MNHLPPVRPQGVVVAVVPNGHAAVLSPQARIRIGLSKAPLPARRDRVTNAMRVAAGELGAAAKRAGRAVVRCVQAAPGHFAGRAVTLPPRPLRRVRANEPYLADVFQEVVVPAIRKDRARRARWAALGWVAGLFLVWWCAVAVSDEARDPTGWATTRAADWQARATAGWIGAADVPWLITAAAAVALFGLAVPLAWLTVRFVLPRRPLERAVRTYFDTGDVNHDLDRFFRAAHALVWEAGRPEVRKNLPDETRFIEFVEAAGPEGAPPENAEFRQALALMVPAIRGRTAGDLCRLASRQVRGARPGWGAVGRTAQALALRAVVVLVCVGVLLHGVPRTAVIASYQARLPEPEREQVFKKLVGQWKDLHPDDADRDDPDPDPDWTGPPDQVPGKSFADDSADDEIKKLNDQFKAIAGDPAEGGPRITDEQLRRAGDEIKDAIETRRKADAGTLTPEEARRMDDQVRQAPGRAQEHIDNARRLDAEADIHQDKANAHRFTAAVARHKEEALKRVAGAARKAGQAAGVLGDPAAGEARKQEAKRDLSAARGELERIRTEQAKRVDAVADALEQAARNERLSPEDRQRAGEAAAAAHRIAADIGAGTPVPPEAAAQIDKSARELHRLVPQEPDAGRQQEQFDKAAGAAAAPDVLRHVDSALQAATRAESAKDDPKGAAGGADDLNKEGDSAQAGSDKGKDEAETAGEQERAEQGNADDKWEQAKDERINAEKILLAALILAAAPGTLLKALLLWKLFSGIKFGSGGGDGGEKGKNQGSSGQQAGPEGPAGGKGKPSKGKPAKGTPRVPANPNGTKGSNTKAPAGQAGQDGRTQQPGKLPGASDQQGRSGTTGPEKGGMGTPSKAGDQPTAEKGDSHSLSHLGGTGNALKLLPASGGGHELVIDRGSGESPDVVARFEARHGSPTVLAVRADLKGAVFADEKNRLWFAAPAGDNAPLTVSPAEIGIGPGPAKLDDVQKELMRLLADHPNAVLVLSEEDAKKNRFWFFAAADGAGATRLLWVHGGEAPPGTRKREVTGALAAELAGGQKAADDLKACLRGLAGLTDRLPTDGDKLLRWLPVLDREDGRLRALVATPGPAGPINIHVADPAGTLHPAGRVSPASYAGLFQGRTTTILPAARRLFFDRGPGTGMPGAGLPAAGWQADGWLLVAADLSSATEASTALARARPDGTTEVRWVTGDQEYASTQALLAAGYQSLRGRFAATYPARALPAPGAAGWPAVYDAWVGHRSPTYPCWNKPRRDNEHPSLLFQEAGVAGRKEGGK